MCRAKDHGGRRCPGCSPAGRRAARASARDAQAQAGMQAFISATPYQEGVSAALLRMSSRPTYYDTDEWAEYADTFRDTADKHGIRVLEQSHTTGLWKGGQEPSAAYTIRYDDYDDVRAFAREIAGRYGQDAVMIGQYDPRGTGTVYVYPASDTDPTELLDTLSAAGIAGATLGDGQLQIVAVDGTLGRLPRSVLRSRLGTPDRSRADVEMITPGPDNPAALHAPIKQIQHIREKYADDHGFARRTAMPRMTEADDIAAAKAYGEGQHRPDDPRIQRSYRVFRQHIAGQWDALTAAGYRFEPWHGTTEQPYRNSAEMIADLREHKHLYYFRTDAGGDLSTGHPMMKKITVTLANGVKRRILANDAFRAVHDAFAHSEGHQFGPYGELRAWWTHRASLPSEARLALWNETRAQNCWTNAGPHMTVTEPDGTIRRKRKGDPGWLPQTARPYGEQKCVIPPHPEAFI